MTSLVRCLILFILVVGKMGFGSDTLYLPTTFKVEKRSEKLKCEKKRYGELNGLLEILQTNRATAFRQLMDEINQPTIRKYVENAIASEDEMRFFNRLGFFKPVEISEEDCKNYLLAYQKNNGYGISWEENFIQEDYEPANTRAYGLINAIAYLARKNLYIYRRAADATSLELRHRFVIDTFKESIKVLVHDDGSYSKLAVKNGGVSNSVKQSISKPQTVIICNSNPSVGGKSANQQEKPSMLNYLTNDDAKHAFEKCSDLIEEGYQRRDMAKFNAALTLAKKIDPKYDHKRYHRLLAHIHLAKANNLGKSGESEYREALRIAGIVDDLPTIAKSNLGIAANCKEDPTPYLKRVIDLSDVLNNPFLRIKACLQFAYYNSYHTVEERRTYALDALISANNLVERIQERNPNSKLLRKANIYKGKADRMVQYLNVKAPFNSEEEHRYNAKSQHSTGCGTGTELSFIFTVQDNSTQDDRSTGDPYSTRYEFSAQNNSMQDDCSMRDHYSTRKGYPKKNNYSKRDHYSPTRDNYSQKRPKYLGKD